MLTLLMVMDVNNNQIESEHNQENFHNMRIKYHLM